MEDLRFEQICALIAARLRGVDDARVLQRARAVDQPGPAASTGQEGSVDVSLA